MPTALAEPRLVEREYAPGRDPARAPSRRLGWRIRMLSLEAAPATQAQAGGAAAPQTPKCA